MDDNDSDDTDSNEDGDRDAGLPGEDEPMDIRAERQKRYNQLSKRLTDLNFTKRFRARKAPKRRKVVKTDAEKERTKIPIELLQRQEAALAAAAAEAETRKLEAEAIAEHERRTAIEEAEKKRLAHEAEEHRAKKQAEIAALKAAEPVVDPEIQAVSAPVGPATEDAFEESFPPGLKNRDIWGTWRRPMDFTITLVGYVVGVQDFWRFPYLCYRFGGVFLIPYTIFTILIAVPTSFVELTIGQYYGVGATEAFGVMAPIMTGVSYMTIWNSITTCWYYGMMITWSRLYSTDAMSCRKGWETCNARAYYNSKRCYTGKLDELCELAYFKSHAKNLKYTAAQKAAGIHDYLYYDFECVNLKTYCYTVHGPKWKAMGGLKMCRHGETGKTISVYKGRTHACTEYFYGGVCGLMNRNRTGIDPENMEEPVWVINPSSTSELELRFFSLTTFLTILIFLTEGFLSVSLITYMLNGLPFLGLAYFTVKALALSHSVSGIEQLVKLGSWSSLLDPEIWVEGVIQAIGTSGIANGVLINLSSFNKAQHNFSFDLVFTSLLNSICCLCATLICFCTIGHYLQHYRINVAFQDFIEVGSVNSSIEFGYIVYTMFLSLMPKEKFSILAFFTIITSFSLDSALRLVQNTLDALTSIFPRLRRYRFVSLLGISMFGVAAILPMTKNGGFVLFLEYEYYLLNFAWLFILLGQTIGVNWIYRTSRLLDNAEQYGITSSCLVRFYITASQQILTPFILVASIGYNVYHHVPVRFNKDNPNVLTQLLGFTFAFTPVMILLVSVIEQLTMNDRSRWSWLCSPEHYHRVDTAHHLYTRRYSGVCATNYGPMTKDDSLMPDDDDMKSGDKGKGPVTSTIRAFAMKWKNAPKKTSKDGGGGPSLRAELVPDTNIKSLLDEDDDEEPEERDTDAEAEDTFQQSFSKRFLKRILDDLEFFAAWPGPLQLNREEPQTTDDDDVSTD